MRYIEQLGEALALLMGVRKQGTPDEALHYIEQLYENYLPENRRMILETEPETLVPILIETQALSSEALNFAGELLYHEGELWEEKGDWLKAKVHYVRALSILEHLHQTDTLYNLERAYKIEKMKRLL